MFKTTILITLFFMVLFPMQANTQVSEKNLGTIKTQETIVQLKEEVKGDSLKGVSTKEINMAAIDNEATESTVLTVIKAISLVIAIFGLAYAYFPKKRKENSNV